MDLQKIDYIEFQYEDKTYEITKLNIDVSKHFEQPEGTVTMTHRIDGFEEPLFLIVNDNENEFYFGYILKEANLMVSLMDDNLINKAIEVLEYALNNYEN